MYSEQVKALYSKASDRRKFSELKVCSSAAGFYVGSTYVDSDGFVEPGSRDSDYMSLAQATALLADLESGKVDYTDSRMRLYP